MRADLIAIAAAVVLIGGTLMGVAALFLVPIVGAIGILALVIWMLRRRAEHKPPIE